MDILMWKIKNFIIQFYNSLLNVLAKIFSRIHKYKTESMKVQIYKNIDLVQINLQAGVSEYYLPQNVSWADEVVHKILVYPQGTVQDCVSPIDGVRELYGIEDTPNIFFDIYSSDEKEIAQNLSIQNIIYANNVPVEINSKISLKLSRLFFSNPPIKDGCLLMYVFWGTKEIETNDRPQNSVTVKFPLKGRQDIPMDEVIDTYIHSQHKNVKGIAAWVGDITDSITGVYMTLRDYTFRTIVKNLPLDMCRPMVGVSDYDILPYWGAAQKIQINPMYLDDEDIDFSNSFIHNPDGLDIDITLTILY